MGTPRLRADLADVPTYRPGRAGTATDAAESPAFSCASNENPYPPLPGVIEAIERAALTVNRYPDMACTRLSVALGDHFDVPVGDVVLGPGSVGVLQQLVTAVAAPGDEVVYAWRSFEAYPIVTRVAGARPVPVPLTDDGRHDVVAMADAVTDRTRLVVVCTPNNPTGPIVSAGELDWLLDQVSDEVVVVVDEAYAEFVTDPTAADGLAFYRDRQNVVVLRTFSKAYGLAGLRVGYGLAHEPVATALRRTSIPFAVSSVAEQAAVESLRHPGELAQRVRGLVDERERVYDGLSTAGWRLPQAQGNFVWFGVGARSTGLAHHLSRAGLAVRTFPDEGVRVTIAQQAANDLLLAALGSPAQWQSQFA